MSSIKERFAPLFLFGSAFLWSLSGIFTKSTAWNGVCLAGLRGLIAFFVVLFLLRGRAFKVTPLKLLTGFCYFAQGVLFMCANKYTTAANATVLQNMSPLYIILFNCVLIRKFPKKREVITCAVLIAGVCLTALGSLGGGAMLGNGFALISALFYAAVFFLSKLDGAEPLESLLYGNAFYFILLPLMVTNQVVRHTSPAEWIFLLIFATFSGIGAWLCFSVGIRHTSALQANFITMSEPVMAPIWTFLFLKETLSPLSLTGCVVVIVTLLLYNLSEK